MTRWWQILLGCLIVVGLILGPSLFLLEQQKQLREFHVVREGVLYRSGQPRVAGLKRLVHERGIRTIINLRDKATSGTQGIDEAEEKFCAKEEINFFRYPPLHFDGPDGTHPVDANVEKFLSVMQDPKNYPVLIHCHAGIHRTGSFCAIFRMEFDHWTNAEAIAEMKACGYVNFDREMDVRTYIENYQPRWKKTSQTAGIPTKPLAEPR